jgi:hypothetical protein
MKMNAINYLSIVTGIKGGLFTTSATIFALAIAPSSSI